MGDTWANGLVDLYRNFADEAVTIGMLSLEQGVIDGTTEEGKEKLRALEEQAAREKEEGQKAREGKPVDERLEEIEVGDPD